MKIRLDLHSGTIARLDNYTYPCFHELLLREFIIYMLTAANEPSICQNIMCFHKLFPLDAYFNEPRSELRKSNRFRFGQAPRGAIAAARMAPRPMRVIDLQAFEVQRAARGLNRP
jgi:hypothetical protein